MTNLLLSRDDGWYSATFSRKISAEMLASNSHGYISFFISLSRPYHFSISITYTFEHEIVPSVTGSMYLCVLLFLSQFLSFLFTNTTLFHPIFFLFHPILTRFGFVSICNRKPQKRQWLL